VDARAKVRQLSADIADMRATAVRVGERDSWDSPVSFLANGWRGFTLLVSHTFE
jgi:hypothetical protein